jgi:cyanophycinase
MTLCNRIVRVRLLNIAWAMLMIVSLAGVALAQLPSHGPTKGYLLIAGGATGQADFRRFIEMSGGKNARIVVIPTASLTKPTEQAHLQEQYCGPNSPFAAVSCTVLHTTDRTIADSAAFVAPLTTATGVWLEGGRHGRLTDAYLDTRTLKEMFNLLSRGGAICGGSAGATVQGSYMVRGSSNTYDNTLMALGHEVGFGFFTNVAIDTHVDTRGRQYDLAPVIKLHPDLLGLGLDQNTSITVHGDKLTVNGPMRVAVWDGKDHDGKGSYYLRTGDQLNTATRVATLVPHPAETTDK